MKRRHVKQRFPTWSKRTLEGTWKILRGTWNSSLTGYWKYLHAKTLRRNASFYFYVWGYASRKRLWTAGVKDQLESCDKNGNLQFSLQMRIKKIFVSELWLVFEITHACFCKCVCVSVCLCLFVRARVFCVWKRAW